MKKEHKPKPKRSQAWEKPCMQDDDAQNVSNQQTTDSKKQNNAYLEILNLESCPSLENREENMNMRLSSFRVVVVHEGFRQ